MTWQIEQTETGFYSVTLRPCTLAVAVLFLPESEDTVWLRRHRPFHYVEWYKARVPITPSTELVARVRDMEFDIQMPAWEFRRYVELFAEFGADLYLMSRPVPDTLTLRDVPESRQAPILVKNGLIASFHLPHDNEFATVEAPERATLERWLQETELSEWVAR